MVLSVVIELYCTIGSFLWYFCPVVVQYGPPCGTLTLFHGASCGTSALLSSMVLLIVSQLSCVTCGGTLITPLYGNFGG
jgi:hypothetical protein